MNHHHDDCRRYQSALPWTIIAINIDRFASTSSTGMAKPDATSAKQSKARNVESELGIYYLARDMTRPPSKYLKGLEPYTLWCLRAQAPV